MVNSNTPSFKTLSNLNVLLLLVYCITFFQVQIVLTPIKGSDGGAEIRVMRGTPSPSTSENNLYSLSPSKYCNIR